jgi:hypothetical protein
MKKIAIMFLLAIITITAKADSYKFLAFETTSGDVTSVSVSNLTMTVSGDNLIATNDNESHTFVLSALSKMYFSDSSTGINNITTVSQSSPVTVYTASGAIIGTFTDSSSLKSALQKGVYLLKSNGQTSKLLVR